jgi:hypothetical protein
VIEVTVAQPRGKLKVLFAGTFPTAKAWARATFPGTKQWFRDADWRMAADNTVVYHQHKAGFEHYPGVALVAGPVAAKFVGRGDG